MTTTTTMEFSVEPAGPCRKRVKVKIPPELVSQEFDKSYRQWIRTVPIPGFRPGKAPRKLVERKFGKQVADEVKQALLDSAFQTALKENDLSPLADPELDIEQVTVEPSQPVDFDFTVTVKPEFELPGYGDIEVAVPPVEPTQEEIDATLENLLKSKATLRPVKTGTIRAEDVVNLDVHGLSGEEELFHEESLPYRVGSRMLGDLIAEGLDEALTGKQAGDRVEAKAFAPPYVTDHPLAGMDVEVKVEVVDHKRPDLPVLDDDLAKRFDFDSKEELVDAVRKDVRRHKEQEREKAIEDLALAQLVEKVDFDLPAELIEREADEIARRAAYELQMQGKEEEEIAREVADLRARRSEETARELKVYFVLDRIVAKERILVPESEVRDAVVQIAAYHRQSPENMYLSLQNTGRLASLRSQLRIKKARAKLRKKVTVKDAPAPQAAAGKKAAGTSARKTPQKKS